ncbi:MAG: FkbM family methyltransferase [Ferruginibacter sp.]
MKNYLGIAKYYAQKCLFDKYAIPKIKYEKISKTLLKKYLPEKPIVIDCGAHDGADSVELAKILKGEIHSFEPVNNLFSRLKTNTHNFPNIYCYEIALSNKNGSQDFYISEGRSDASSSLLMPKAHLDDHPDTFFKTKITVKTLTLDYWAEINKIEKVDLLWLDMQGFELNMLEVSEKILAKVSVIHTEVSTKETFVGVAQYAEYREFLENKGFNVVLEAIPVGWDMGNVLFVRK